MVSPQIVFTHLYFVDMLTSYGASCWNTYHGCCAWAVRVAKSAFHVCHSTWPAKTKRTLNSWNDPHCAIVPLGSVPRRSGMVSDLVTARDTWIQRTWSGWSTPTTLVKEGKWNPCCRKITRSAGALTGDLSWMSWGLLQTNTGRRKPKARWYPIGSLQRWW